VSLISSASAGTGTASSEILEGWGELVVTATRFDDQFGKQTSERPSAIAQSATIDEYPRRSVIE